MNIFRAYHRVMTNHPIKTQCLTTAFLVSSGDLIAQKLIEKQPELIVKRTVKFALFGLLFVGPSISVWYRILDRRFGPKQLLLKPWQKVMIDQATFNPSIHLMAIIVLGLMSQESFKAIKTNIHDNYVDIMKNSYKVWPAVQMSRIYIGIFIGMEFIFSLEIGRKRKIITAKFALFGLVYIGPCISLWYRFLDRSFGRSKQIILKPWQKMIIDQSTFSPLINLFALPILGLMNRKSMNEIWKNINDNYVDIMMASYKIWPAVQIANFYLIPLNYRAIFASMFALIWNSYFTWKLGEKK
ncbi:Protein Mpv17 [Dermatophagoides farinae]|uniref:Mitochondrial inner membrane protein Mpv17 n=1 Tax=Dermatophagoides farinae TaxID=6954 RepID=A0A922HU35_DERFA|nr:Protein Mpv17 [Dermatophagoides farinae]